MVTPLARQVIEQIILPSEKRTFIDLSKMSYRMADIHCFEVSEVLEESNVLVEKGGFNGLKLMAELTTFLPAPKTWIEWKNPNGNRVGCLLEDRISHAQVNVVVSTQDQIVSMPEIFGLPLVETIKNNDLKIIVPETQSFERGYDLGSLAATLIGVLAFINTPKIIGRKQHVAKKTLEQRVQKKIGVFPLNAWVEVVLKVTPPVDKSKSGTVEAHLTGQKALHFCRKHLRIQYGKLVWVKAHWRGNPALGTVNTRYKVTT